MELIKKLKCLNKLDLADIAYLYGKKADFFLEDKKRPSFFKVIFSIPINIGNILMSVYRNFKFNGSNSKHLNCDYLFFAGTMNQFDCLKNTLNNIQSKDTILIKGRIETGNQDALKIKFNISDILYGSFFVFTKGFIFLFKNMNINRKGLVYGGDKFLSAFFYCTYFFRILNHFKPKIVVVSNDHNAPNRSLLHVSKYLGIKTAYLQHASVSNYFPPLEFDYAFLDGIVAYEAYKESELSGDIVNKKVFLSGCQKPIIYRSNIKGKKDNSTIIVGLAINTLDGINDVLYFCEQLIKFQYVKIILRNHPGQDANILRKKFELLRNVKIEDSRVYSSTDFFNKIDLMIAGNTSIHLEASLAGIPCYYIEFGKCSLCRKDYYGYLRSGLIDLFPNVKELNKNILQQLIIFDQNKKQIPLKLYSNTFASKWEGKEGEIVALTIQEICSNTPISLFKLNFYDDISQSEVYDILNDE